MRKATTMKETVNKTRVLKLGRIDSEDRSHSFLIELEGWLNLVPIFTVNGP